MNIPFSVLFFIEELTFSNMFFAASTLKFRAGTEIMELLVE